MRGKRQDLPTNFEGMEQHLLDAWKRIEAGCPTNPQLVELAKKGKLKSTPTSVAKEAGVSRTLIGYDQCRYAMVRRQILGQKALVRVATDMRSVNSDLRKINIGLEKRLKNSLSEQAAMLNRMRKLELEYDDKVDEITRVRARATRNPHEVIGLHIVRPKK